MDLAITVGSRVKVYRNLHKKLWSVVDAKTNRVTFHAPTLAVADAVFRVSEKVRDRVVANRRKEVHARVWGVLTEPLNPLPHLVPATYNPYVAPHFFLLGSDIKVVGSPFVLFREDGHLDILLTPPVSHYHLYS